ncbi:hypothetical protein ABZ729_10070 [Streptomyces sp. NPDC006678]|uniref:hypothetical protein n=1 Tax=Streptomyces sp. NPDC006678 TaxID=3157185 RepID=UPI0033D74AE4
MTRRRKERLSARTVVAVVAVTAVSGGGVVFALGGGTRAVAEPTVIAVRSMAEVRLVEAGERIDTGRGNMIWLTADGRLVADVRGDTWGHLAQPRTVLGPDAPDAAIDAVSFAEPAGTLYVGVYRGPGRLARATVHVGGVTLNAKVVTLAGGPGWAAFYVDGPPRAGEKARVPAVITLTGYAADGTVLAHMTPPVLE